jgi:hypothetical protein
LMLMRSTGSSAFKKFERHFQTRKLSKTLENDDISSCSKPREGTSLPSTIDCPDSWSTTHMNSCRTEHVRANDYVLTNLLDDQPDPQQQSVFSISSISDQPITTRVWQPLDALPPKISTQLVAGMIDISISCPLLPPLHTIIQDLAKEESSTGPSSSSDVSGLNVSRPVTASPQLGATPNSSAEEGRTATPPQLTKSAPSDLTNEPLPTQANPTSEVWRRPPKRWGLADWPGDDSAARERRREQNRLSQRRFREKRHRRDAPRTEPPILTGWAAALVAGGGMCGEATI